MTTVRATRIDLRVLKLGGSLFDCPDLAVRFHAWLSHQPPATNLVVAGGGELAEAIRGIDRVHPLGEVAAHRLCIRAMSLTAELAARLLGCPLLTGWPWNLPPTAADGTQVCVIDVARFVERDREQSQHPLPEGWQVTSDSIAARLADERQADELVLLKSELPEGASLEELGTAGYVDSHFHLAATTRPLRFVNLRGPLGGTERVWGADFEHCRLNEAG